MAALDLYFACLNVIQLHSCASMQGFRTFAQSHVKSPSGKCTSAQRAVREALLRSGCQWFECRSANAAMVAIAACGVRFRKNVNADGTVERWRKPKLAPWEVPRRDPGEPRPRHPEVAG
jgi:hypothetical protein